MLSCALLLLATTIDATDDLSPMMAVLLLTWLVVVGCLVVAGVLLALLLVGALLGLLATGAFSASVLVGLKTRSAATGAKTFGLLLAAGLGLPVGAAGFWLLSRLAHLSVTTRPALALGGVGGAVAGVLTAYVAGWAGRQVVAYAGRTLRLH